MLGEQQAAPQLGLVRPVTAGGSSSQVASCFMAKNVSYRHTVPTQIEEVNHVSRHLNAPRSKEMPLRPSSSTPHRFSNLRQSLIEF